jgi:hypothetical protein
MASSTAFFLLLLRDLTHIESAKSGRSTGRHRYATRPVAPRAARSCGSSQDANRSLSQLFALPSTVRETVGLDRAGVAHEYEHPDAGSGSPLRASDGRGFDNLHLIGNDSAGAAPKSVAVARQLRDARRNDQASIGACPDTTLPFRAISESSHLSTVRVSPARRADDFSVRLHGGHEVSAASRTHRHRSRLYGPRPPLCL